MAVAELLTLSLHGDFPVQFDIGHLGSNGIDHFGFPVTLQ